MLSYCVTLPSLWPCPKRFLTIVPIAWIVFDLVVLSAVCRTLGAPTVGFRTLGARTVSSVGIVIGVSVVIHIW